MSVNVRNTQYITLTKQLILYPSKTIETTSIIDSLVGQWSRILTHDPCDPSRSVDPFDPWPTDPLSALVNTCVNLRPTFDVRHSPCKYLQRGVVAKCYKLCYCNINFRPKAAVSMTPDAILLLHVPRKLSPNAHGLKRCLKQCTFGVDLHGTGSRNMASAVIERAARGRIFLLLGL